MKRWLTRPTMALLWITLAGLGSIAVLSLLVSLLSGCSTRGAALAPAIEANNAAAVALDGMSQAILVRAKVSAMVAESKCAPDDGACRIAAVERVYDEHAALAARQDEITRLQNLCARGIEAARACDSTAVTDQASCERKATDVALRAARTFVPMLRQLCHDVGKACPL